MAKAATKKAAAPRKKESASPNELIVKACESALAKLSDLNLDHQLQAEINWCLGSYHNDGNPVGLYHMAQRALDLFKAEQSKKTKGVTAKLISDLTKAIAAS